MFSFLDYVFEIWTVALTIGVDVGVAFDMFRADIGLGGKEPRNTGKALPDCDFAALYERGATMTADDMLDALDEYSAFAAANYSAICKAYPNGREAVDVIVEAWYEHH